MIITKMHVSRRSVLRGFGATLALPLLDSMVPALSALAKTPAASPRRMAVIYTPNGMMMPNWTPRGEGTGFEFSPILEGLAPYRDTLTIISGLADKYGWPQADEGTGDHARAAATFLTGVHVKKTEGADIRGGISMDQIAAKALGRETQVASLELAIESVEFLGACDSGYSCAYANTISWRSPTVPLPMENEPRAVFERLFGGSDSTDTAARAARIAKEKSILDSVTERVRELERGLGPKDRVKMGEYLEAVRDVERRMQMAEAQRAREFPVVERPAGMPATFEKHARLMCDLLLLAFQTDLTRISTFMLGREVSGRAYPEIGVPDSHHPTSHHQNDPEKLNKLQKINTFHVKQFAYFLKRMTHTPDGDGSLLDHSCVLYGSGISDSNIHMHDNLPLVLAGGASGRLKGGRQLVDPKDTPVTNLFINMLDTIGVPADTIGDSTGRLQGLTDL
ncbi:MAG: DUF1552 domain-containing protein [Acidimicrobiia bacterium]|nr:DUF1552 domain-containing protein [Acidimicrobiia bacterium]